MTPIQRLDRWGPPFVLLIASGIFLASTRIRALALDEAATLGFARADFLDYLNTVIRSFDAVHATYYLLVRPFANLSITEIRLISAIAMILTTYFVMRIAERIADRRTAILAGLTLPIIPISIEAAATARSFALAALLVTWSWWLLIRLLTGELSRRRVVLMYVVVSTMSMAVFLLAGFSLIAQFLFVFASTQSRRVRIRIHLFQVLSAFLALPVAVLAIIQRGQLAGVERLDASNLLEIPVYFFGQGLQVGLGGLPSWLSWMFVAVAAAVSLFGFFHHRATQNTQLSMNRVVLTWLLLPLGLIAITSLAMPLLAPRYLVMLTPALALAIAQGVRRFSSRAASAFFVSAWLVALAVIFTRLLTPAGTDAWGEKSAILERFLSPQDAVVFAPDLYVIMAEQSNTSLPIVLEQAAIADGALVDSRGDRIQRIWAVPFVASDLTSGSSRWIPEALEDSGFSSCPAFPTSSGSVRLFTRNQAACPS